MIQLYGKKIKEKKLYLFNKQNGKCCLCNSELESFSQAHLDHDHLLTGKNAGKVRGLLCNLCNSLEGQIRHKFRSSGLVAKGIDEETWLRAHVDYVFNDYSDADFHIRYINDMIKQFSKLTLPEQKAIMNENNFIYDVTDKKKDLVTKYRKQFTKYQKSLGVKNDN